MQRFDAILRRLVPAVPTLSRHRLLMVPLDLLDRILSIPWGAETKTLPPNRFRIRVGVGNRVLFNQMVHRLLPVDFWLSALASGLVRLDSRVLDIGSGCGRYASTLRDLDFYGTGFSGHYTGIDVDREMVEWCRAHFPPPQFTFLLSSAFSTVYNPTGETPSEPRYDLDDAGQDFVFSISLLTHLLEEEFQGCVQEAYRVLVPGAAMLMTVFCMDHLEGRLGGRWTFRHRRGEAHLESEDHPEAAVAYSLPFIESACRRAGFQSIEVTPGDSQSLLHARKPDG
jgi:SAM-dependent methyltransferase